jgi:hypothetical protein
MRPTDKTRNQDLARSQGDHSTLYVSLELSRSSWRPEATGASSTLFKRSWIAVIEDCHVGQE